MDTEVSPPQNSFFFQAQETLHFRYLKCLVMMCLLKEGNGIYSHLEPFDDPCCWLEFRPSFDLVDLQNCLVMLGWPKPDPQGPGPTPLVFSFASGCPAASLTMAGNVWFVGKDVPGRKCETQQVRISGEKSRKYIPFISR